MSACVRACVYVLDIFSGYNVKCTPCVHVINYCSCDYDDVSQ